MYNTEEDDIYKYDRNSRNYKTLVTVAKHLKLPEDKEKEEMNIDDADEKTTTAPKSYNNTVTMMNTTKTGKKSRSPN